MVKRFFFWVVWFFFYLMSLIQMKQRWETEKKICEIKFNVNLWLTAAKAPKIRQIFNYFTVKFVSCDKIISKFNNNSQNQCQRANHWLITWQFLCIAHFKFIHNFIISMYFTHLHFSGWFFCIGNECDRFCQIIRHLKHWLNVIL